MWREGGARAKLKLVQRVMGRRHLERHRRFVRKEKQGGRREQPEGESSGRHHKCFYDGLTNAAGPPARTSSQAYSPFSCDAGGTQRQEEGALTNPRALS